MHSIDQKIQDLGLTLPEAAMPAANYVPTMTAAGQIVVSGQLPMQDGKPQFIGKVGREYSIEEGQACARICALNILAHVRAAVNGDWDKIDRLVRLGVFVNAPDDFTDHPKVANGVSDLMVEIFGDAGKHARFAVGVSGLPFGVAVEVDATFALK